MTIRPMVEADLPGVTGIQSRSPAASQWNPRDYLDHEATVCEIEGTVAGFLVTRRVAADECEVLNLAVDPVRRRQGVAAALMREACTRSPGTWFLEVRASNEAARNLYKKMGFRERGVRSAYYAEPQEDCIVMGMQS